MPPIHHFDCRCYLGRHMLMGPGEPETAADLLAEMDHFGIGEALVLDPMAVGHTPMAGNRRIVERTREHPRLRPAWCGLMTASAETPPPRDLVAEMRECGVGALYLFYGQFGMPLEDWAVDDLLAALQEAGAPVFLCPNPVLGAQVDETDWGNVVRICREFPALPVVVSEYRIYSGQRRMYQALEHCPNLTVDLTGIWLHRKVEFICERFGADRLVWSSRMPLQTPAASLMQLDYSDLSEQDLTAIAGGNMRRLLSWNPSIRFAEPAEFSPPVDELHRKARERVSLRGEGFLDCHGHICWGSRRHVIHDTPEALAAEMDRLGVQVCCVFPSAGSQPDEVYGNDECAAMVQAYPDRFIGFTLVNPNRGEAMMWDELERGYARGMRGVKLAQSFQGYPTEGPLIDVPCRFAHEHGLFILNHDWGSAAQMRRLCETYPGALFIAGHSMGHFAEITRDVPNLYICTCPFLGWGQTEQFAQLYGADRLLFGSDLMDLPIAWGLGPILYARIPEPDKRLILGGNLGRLMREYGIAPQGLSVHD